MFSLREIKIGLLYLPNDFTSQWFFFFFQEFQPGKSHLYLKPANSDQKSGSPFKTHLDKWIRCSSERQINVTHVTINKSLGLLIRVEALPSTLVSALHFIILQTRSFPSSFLHLYSQRELLPFNSLQHVPSVNFLSFALGDNTVCGFKQKSARIFLKYHIRGWNIIGPFHCTGSRKSCTCFTSKSCSSGLWLFGVMF